ncbi:MAG: rod shape-determining protein MreC [Prevotellaceae bacterium]|jgi:rod shape-determining protein MreC|nr:rod shape-determining protein MreC [Prevotellaceae bacterium]
MGTLLKFILRFRVFIIFLVLEGIAVTLLLRNSYYQQTQMYGVMQVVQNYCFKQVSALTSYLALSDDNKALLLENAKLRNMLDHYQSIDTAKNLALINAGTGTRLTYMPAKVVNSTTNKQHNYLVLDIDKWEDITPDMGVITDNGVVGIVVSTSAHYAIVMSLLNRDFKISARIKQSGYLGTLMWDGLDYREAILSEVPQHVSIAVGDTIETSGYSAVFPEGIFIGTATSHETKKGNFHEIRVKLEVDFKKLRHVNVTKFVHYEELRDIERQISTQQILYK